MAKIRLTKGKFALVSKSDVKRVSEYRWCLGKKEGDWVTAVHRTSPDLGNRVQTLAEFIIGKKDGKVIRYINGNPLDNRRENLGHVTRSICHGGRRKIKKCTSIYKGVYWDKRLHAWVAYVSYLGKKFHLGVFRSEQKAGRAYDEAASTIFGKYARLNFKG